MYKEKTMERFDSVVRNRVGKIKTREPLPIAILTDSDKGETYPGPYVDIFIGNTAYTVTPLVDLDEFTEMLEKHGLTYNVRYSRTEDQPDA
jgi:hypothetical protein